MYYHWSLLAGQPIVNGSSRNCSFAVSSSTTMYSSSSQSVPSRSSISTRLFCRTMTSLIPGYTFYIIRVCCVVRFVFVGFLTAGCQTLSDYSFPRFSCFAPTSFSTSSVYFSAKTRLRHDRQAWTNQNSHRKSSIPFVFDTCPASEQRSMRKFWVWSFLRFRCRAGNLPHNTGKEITSRS